ncbi:predicted protein [Uncinocarpus reesii 1704]|uniref:Integral membrane protein n=1 Tax=Uncinocarpus reesii (strain UAMH 1704) TaxID=336963 RepID=C4JL48_UNCRE|nr:uncharacterized protein UREG_00263 [Uncinocarpus reesii 1704]EEP75417.1 predicted protein [Uncinocarpus reesii 1704]
MATSRLSQSPSLRIAASITAAIFVGFGVNAILRPDHALTFFEFAPPAAPADRKVVDGLMAVYGARDIFMGLAMYSALWFGTTKSLGWTVLGAGAVAFADGAVCWSQGGGQWNHWGYTPLVMAIGSVLLGVLD